MEIICTDLSKEARVENFYASGITFGAGGWGATFTKSDDFSPTPPICTFHDTQCLRALTGGGLIKYTVLIKYTGVIKYTVRKPILSV